jgi:hypothetical protein
MIALDPFTTPGEAPPRKANTFRRRTEQGSPIVLSLTKTQNRTGTADEHKAAAAAAGIDLSAEAKTRGVQASGKLAAELLGPMPADETYNRPSSLSDWIAGEQVGLDRWKDRNIIKGLAKDPGLLERLDLAGNPGGNDSAIIDSVIGAARNAAHDTMASERGTFFHSLTEWADAGMKPGQMPWCDPRFNLTDKMVEAAALGWLAFLADHGLTVLASEITVVCDEFRAAGSVDRFVANADPIPFGTGDIEMPAGLALALDIKTSKYRPGDWGYATQIYLYAASVGYDTLTDTRSPHPFSPVSTDHGLIAHLDMDKLTEGKACWTLIHVDLGVGHRANVAVAEAIAIDKLNAFTSCDTSTSTDANEPAAPAEPVTDADRMAALKARHALLNSADQRRFLELRIDMKGDIETIKAGIDSVDPMTRARPEPVAKPEPVVEAHPPRLTATTDEGDLLTDTEAEEARVHYRTLSPNQTTWLAEIATAARQGGASLDMKFHPATTRRGYLITSLSKFAAWAIADADDADAFAKVISEADRNIHDAIDIAIGHGHDWGLHSTGTVVATMNVEQSQALYGLVNLAVADSLPLASSDWQRPAFAEVANQITPQAAA